MNPYQYQCVCDVCGETGVAHVRHAGMDWLHPESFTHKDPRVCADNIRRRMEAALRAKEQAEIASNGSHI